MAKSASNMSNVIVVPEQIEFREDILEGEVIYINDRHGEPKLEERDVRYVAPYFIDEQRVFRLYHILEMRHVAPNYEIYLGTSFEVENAWNSVNQNRRFEYHPLTSFGYTEERPGILIRQ